MTGVKHKAKRQRGPQDSSATREGGHRFGSSNCILSLGFTARPADEDVPTVFHTTMTEKQMTEVVRLPNRNLCFGFFLIACPQ